MSGKTGSTWRGQLISPIAVIAGLLAWEISARLFIDPFFLPPVSVIFLGAVELYQKDLLFVHIGVSMARILTGWVLGSLIAIPIGLIVGSFLTAKRIVDPFIHFLRFIPAIALVTLFIVWFGVGELSKILLVMYATSFIVLIPDLDLKALFQDRLDVCRHIPAGISWSGFRLCLENDRQTCARPLCQGKRQLLISKPGMTL